MKFSFVAVALLAARASAIPVAADDAAGAQNTHGALGLPGTEALTGLASKLGVPVEALAEQILGAATSLLHIKRDGEGDDQVTHGALGLPGTEALTGLASKLGVPVEALAKQILGAATSLLHVKRDGEGDDQVTHGALGLPGTEALTGLASKLGVPVEALAKQILGAATSLLHIKRGEESVAPANENTVVDNDCDGLLD